MSGRNPLFLALNQKTNFNPVSRKIISSCRAICLNTKITTGSNKIKNILKYAASIKQTPEPMKKGVYGTPMNMGGRVQPLNTVLTFILPKAFLQIAQHHQSAMHQPK